MLDKVFGLSEKSLDVTEKRALMITNNIVNGSTPQYKAKDIDFSAVMQNVNEVGLLTTTSAGHIQNPEQVFGAQIKYRVPMQTSIDGNTVDPEIERKNFLENSLRYQVSLTFIQNKTDELMKAYKGE